MNKVSSFAILFLIFYSSSLFAQLDSVYYTGPFPGSVTGGAVQTTDNFGDSYVFPVGEPKFIPLVETQDFDFDEFSVQLDKTHLTESIYVEDGSTFDNPSGNSGQTVLLNSFNGIGMTNSFPPDPTMASGPNHIIVCVNSLFRIFDKEGNVLKTISGGAWWSPLTPDENGDVQVIYDHYSERWVLLWLQLNQSNNTAGNLVAYSDDDDPLGTWYMYSLPTVNSWGDYPKIGFDEEAIYIMDRIISWGGGYLYNQIRIIGKAELYASNAGPLTYKDIRNIRVPGLGAGSPALDVIHPAISYTPGSGGWFFWSRGHIGGGTAASGYYAMYKITNPLSTAPSFRGKQLNLTTPHYTPPNANQFGGGVPLETVGWMSRAPVVRDGYLYAAHDIRSTINTNYSSVKFLKINLTTNQIEEDVEFGSPGYFYLYPGVTVDKDHNVAITFTRSGDTEYAGAYYTTRHASAPPDGFIPSKPFAEGQANYQILQGGTRNRWGDYMGIYLDPDNDYDVWMLTEYAATNNTWGTQVGQIRMAPYDSAHAFVNPSTIDFGSVEVGTTSEVLSVIVANYGDRDLNITGIPATTGDFTLEDPTSFPVTIPSYDSLDVKFSFTPSITGIVSETYPISSNDPDFTGLTLTGNGYKMYPALDRTVYASSGSQNNGEILTIDKTTGAGTNIGPSLFNEVKGITVDPNSGIIYGLIVYNNESDIVRVNSGGGDSYRLFTVDIGLMADIAFDTSGTLYGITRNGDLYTFDLANGSYNFVVDAAASYTGMTFHPGTNELWATSRSFVPPQNEAVFKVNLTTGDTTLVGYTGLGKPTNDIVFDENLNLYGITGTASELNDFISIDPANGVGAVIGSVGLKNIVGLAYEETGVTSVKESDIGLMPSDYSLSQNYPNPFNPSTSIEFSVPVNSNVTLTIYNLLGQVVTRLMDQDVNSGSYIVVWNGNDMNGLKVSSGIYFYEMKARGDNGIDYSEMKKMVLLK
jgi:hypothetical protein